MGFLSVADVVASIVTSVVTAVGGLLCGPLCNKIKTSMDVLNAPDSFAADAEMLSNMINDIKVMRPSDEINKWLPEAEKIKDKARQVLQVESSSQVGGLQLSCCIFGHGVSRCKLHKKMRKLTTQGQNIKACANLAGETVVHIPGVPPVEDGTSLERNLRKVMDMLSDDAVWIISICGPGGVGKTTLANALNNKLEDNSSFTLVKLVPLTKDLNDKQVQKAIAKKLGLELGQDMDFGTIALQILHILQRSKFLLILDNVWKSINLEEMGIPPKPKGSKVILTTRLENVYKEMKAKPVKIGYLTDEEAWKLFVEKTGDVANDPNILSLAKDVCRECGCLPLAIVAVGSAMSLKTETYEWQSAIIDLKSSIFPDDIESKVYNPLKLSFDFLPNETLKSCFLYCSLYPEGYTIDVDELIQCWLAEDIIDKELNHESAYSKELDLIEKLKKSHLLETIEYGDYIKMHDVVRDVAIRIAELKSTSIVFSGRGSIYSSNVVFPNEAENIGWISFVDNEKIVLPEGKNDFPKVTTLLICKTKGWLQVSKEFLQGFPALRVLIVYDLPSFPCSHCHLTELRVLRLRHSSTELEELPCGAKLMVLDLSCSVIYKWPRGIEKQANLRVLNLRKTRIMESSEVDIILKLSALERLDMSGTGYKWHTTRRRRSKSEELVLEDLSRLKSLKEVFLDLADVEATYAECRWIERLKSFAFLYREPVSYVYSPGQRIISIKADEIEIGCFILHADHLRLSCSRGHANVNKVFANFNSNDLSTSKMKSLEIANYSFSTELIGSVPNSNALPNLERLSLSLNGIGVRNLNQIAYALGTTFPKLREVTIHLDAGISELENIFSSDYPHMVLPELEVIVVRHHQGMTEVFHDGPANTQPFAPKLKYLHLYNMVCLQNLCNYESSKQCDSLEVLSVQRCPNLKKLPNMSSIQEIRGEEEWWNNLEWDSPETKSSMNQIFKPTRSW